MKKVDVVLGLQWGDEGKGKVVDVLTPAYRVIARFQRRALPPLRGQEVRAAHDSLGHFPGRLGQRHRQRRGDRPGHPLRRDRRPGSRRNRRTGQAADLEESASDPAHAPRDRRGVGSGQGKDQNRIDAQGHRSHLYGQDGTQRTENRRYRIAGIRRTIRAAEGKTPRTAPPIRLSGRPDRLREEVVRGNRESQAFPADRQRACGEPPARRG